MARFGGSAAIAAVHARHVLVCGGHHGHVAGFGGRATIAAVHARHVHVCGGHHGHVAGFGGSATIAAVHARHVHVCGGHHGHVAGFGGSAAIAAVHARHVLVCGGHHGHVAGFGGSAAIAAVHARHVRVCGGHHGHVAGFGGSAAIAAVQVVASAHEDCHHNCWACCDQNTQPQQGWHHADFLTHQGIDFGQGNLLQGSFAVFSLLECFSFPHGCRENDDIIYPHAVLQPSVAPREPPARLTAAASRYGDMHIVHLHSTSSPCQNPLHHRNCIC